jgi:hypothetical protein
VSGHDDCIDDMRATMAIDQDIEKLLSGGVPAEPEIAALEGFIGTLRSLRPEQQPDGHVSQLVAQAASLARKAETASVTQLEARPRRRHSIRLAPVAAALSGVLVMGMTSVAMAADGAAPGDFLYGVDRALEKMGVGDGGIHERITEAGVLMVHGAPVDALVHLDESLVDDDDQVTEEVTERVQIHLDLAGNMVNPTAADVQATVASILEFIEAHKGQGVGADGRDFGQGVSENAKGNGQPPTDGETAGPGGQGQGQGQGNGNQGQGRGNRGGADS